MHGDFIWYELMTPDADAAAKFYGSVLAWTIGDQPEYREIVASEGHVGGMLPLTPEMLTGGATPRWVGYIHVENVDDAATSIEHGGGRVLKAAWDLPEAGRVAMVTDPGGVPFYVMKPKPPAGQPNAQSLAFSYDKKRIGHCAWNELMTADPAAAWHFYGQRFGWVKDGEMDMGPLGKYEFIKHPARAKDDVMGSGMVGAIMPLMPGAPAPAWSHYFRVADIDAAAEAIKANGGQVLRGPDEIPGGDFSLNAVDPQGAVFALVGERKKG
jgi:uncharacterized protein